VIPLAVHSLSSPLAAAVREGRSTPAVARELDTLLGWMTRSEDPGAAALAAELGGPDADELRCNAFQILEQLIFARSAGDTGAALGLGLDVPLERVRKRYRLLMRVYHPDRAEGDTGWFHERAARIGRAYADHCARAERAKTWEPERPVALKHLSRKPEATPGPQRPRRAVQRPMALPSAPAVTIAVLLLTTPLALGGAPDWARACMVAVLASLFAVEATPRALRGGGLRPEEKGWLAVALAILSIVALQLVPLPAAVAQRAGAQPTWIHALGEIPTRLSAAPLETLTHGASWSAYWALAWMVSRLRQRDARALAFGIAGLAAFQAFYGLYSLAHGSEWILVIWPKEHYRGDATGTYVNRNHFAGLLAASWPISLSVILSRRTGGSPALRASLAIVFSVVIGAALVASHSRLGLVSGFAGACAWLVLERRGRRSRAGLPAAIAVGLLVAALAGGLFVGAVETVERFSELASSGDRAAVWRATLQLPARTWWLGAGLGAFGDVFKTVQPIWLQASYPQAHSDWLESAVEIGGVGMVALLVAGLYWWRRVRPVRMGTLGRGALAGVFAVLLHSCADFGLQLPGTALVFWALVGMLANAELEGRRRRARP